jgi:hypothetical protein
MTLPLEFSSESYIGKNIIDNHSVVTHHKAKYAIHLVKVATQSLASSCLFAYQAHQANDKRTSGL